MYHTLRLRQLIIRAITSSIQRLASRMIGDLEDQNSQEREEMMGSLRLEKKAKEHALVYSCLLGYLLKLKASSHTIARCEHLLHCMHNYIVPLALLV